MSALVEQLYPDEFQPIHNLPHVFVWKIHLYMFIETCGETSDVTMRRTAELISVGVYGVMGCLECCDTNQLTISVDFLGNNSF